MAIAVAIVIVVAVLLYVFSQLSKARGAAQPEDAAKARGAAQPEDTAQPREPQPRKSRRQRKLDQQDAWTEKR